MLTIEPRGVWTRLHSAAKTQVDNNVDYIRQCLPVTRGSLDCRFERKHGVLLGGLMTSDDFRSMCTDELWILYQEITDVLAEKMVTKKVTLEERLCELDTVAERMRGVRRRRSYPPVLPKYHNPDNLVQTWSGRGKTPLWLKTQLTAGNRLENFLIDRPCGEGRRSSG